jgi:hypothetical protein
MLTREYTVEQVFEALKQNGFEHLRENWFSRETGKQGACVLGQAAINLNSVDPLLLRGDEEVEEDKNFISNQLDRWAYRGRKWRWNTPQRLGLAQVIIHWNDERDYSRVGDNPFALKTYEDVVQMAYDVLRPHFDKIVKLNYYG